MTQKKFLAISSTLFLIGSLFLTVALVRERQIYRGKAVGPDWLLPIPETFPKFFSSNPANDTLLNDFFYRHFSAMVGPNAKTGDQQTEWREWDSLASVWINTSTNKILSNGCNVIGSNCNYGSPCGACENVDYNYWLRKNLLETKIEDNGLVWTYWDWGRDWPSTGGHHPTNNTALILASARYFNWTGDTEFLRLQVPRMRKALRYLQADLKGDQFGFIENRLSGQEGTSNAHSSNYWDALPFGFRDTYTTIYFYSSLKAMSEIERFVEGRPELEIAANPYGESSTSYLTKAGRVKDTASIYFWNDSTGATPKNLSKGRLAATVDINGVIRDYGYTFLNLEAVYKDFLSDIQSRAVMSWISGSGSNEFPSDKSRGTDIYMYEFAPRVSTKENSDWYLLWARFLGGYFGGGKSLQNGGVDLFVSFYDILGRIKYLSADNGFDRLEEILSWYNRIWSTGGYSANYSRGENGLQGCAPWGRFGIDCEFSESTLVPLSFLYGFLGVEAKIDGLHIQPKLPSELSFAGVDNLYYQGKLYKITTSKSVSVPTVVNSDGKVEVTVPNNYDYTIPPPPLVPEPTNSVSVGTVEPIMTGTTITGYKVRVTLSGNPAPLKIFGGETAGCAVKLIGASGETPGDSAEAIKNSLASAGAYCLGEGVTTYDFVFSPDESAHSRKIFASFHNDSTNMAYNYWPNLAWSIPVSSAAVNVPAVGEPANTISVGAVTQFVDNGITKYKVHVTLTANPAPLLSFGGKTETKTVKVIAAAAADPSANPPVVADGETAIRNGLAQDTGGIYLRQNLDSFDLVFTPEEYGKKRVLWATFHNDSTNMASNYWPNLAWSIPRSSAIVNVPLLPTPPLTTPISLTFSTRWGGISRPGVTKAFEIRFVSGSVDRVYEFTAASGGSGVFSVSSLALTGLTPGSYAVYIRDINSGNYQGNHLRKNLGNITLIEGLNTAPSTWGTDPQYFLKPGDVVRNGAENNIVNITDIAAELSVYTALSVPVNDLNRVFDINGDNRISVEDISLALGTYTALSVSGD